MDYLCSQCPLNRVGNKNGRLQITIFLFGFVASLQRRILRG